MPQKKIVTLWAQLLVLLARIGFYTRKIIESLMNQLKKIFHPDRINAFFQFLSKTDQEILAMCPEYTRKNQTSLGIFVFFTGIFAFLSGAFAIHAAFPDPRSYISIGLIYSCMIMAIDREIVSANSRLTAAMRLPLALVIGIIIAIPLEMKLFEDRILQQLKVLENRVNDKSLLRKHAQEDFLTRRVDALEKQISEYRQKISEAQYVMLDETIGTVKEGRTGKAGQGPAYDAARELFSKHEELLNKAQTEHDSLLNSQVQLRGEFKQEYEQRYVAQVYGFLSRYEALESLKAESESAFWMAWGVRMLLVLIEMFPALIKIMTPKNEYSALIEAERQKNLMRISGIANLHMSEILNDPLIPPNRSLKEELKNYPLTK